MIDKNVDKIKQTGRTPEVIVSDIESLNELKKDANFIEKIKINHKIHKCNKELAHKMGPMF